MSHRVLVARLDSVGDVLLAGPAVRAIAAGGGSPRVPREVWMLCSPQGAPAARLLPGVTGVITWAAPWISEPAPEATSQHSEELLSQLHELQPAEAIILTSFHQSPLPLALLLRQARVAAIAGASVDHAGSLLDVRLCPGEDFPEDQPEAERGLVIAQAAGYRLPAGDDGELRVTAPPDVSELFGPGTAASQATSPGGYVVIHPGAAVPARAWPASHYVAAVRLLVAAGIRVVVTGGPGERVLTRTVAGARALDLGGRTDLATLSGVLAGAAVVITGNTGPAHLAAAVGTPVVSLFSPVVPAIRWAPYRVPVELLGDQHAACRNSRARDCPVPGHPCLSLVLPGDVVAACLRLYRIASAATEGSQEVAV